MEKNPPYDLEARNQFIDENSHLFWYLKKDALHDISDEVLVEFIMNYGDLDAIRKMFKVLKFEHLQSIYTNLKGRKKMNYFPDVYNFFGLLIKKHA